MLTALVKTCPWQTTEEILGQFNYFKMVIIFLPFFLLFCVGIYYVAGESDVLALLNKQFIVPICS